MTRRRIYPLAIALLAVLCATAVFAAAEKSVKLAELPPAVRETIEHQVALTGAKIKSTTAEVEKGKTTYECESVRPNGKRQDFEVAADGQLREVEDAVEPGELPAKVKTAVDEATAGGGTIRELISVTVNQKLIGYGVTVVKNGRAKEYEMNLDGSPKKG